MGGGGGRAYVRSMMGASMLDVRAGPAATTARDLLPTITCKKTNVTIKKRSTVRKGYGTPTYEYKLNGFFESRHLASRDADPGPYPHYFLEAGSESAIEGKTGSGFALKAKFRSFRG